MTLIDALEVLKRPVPDAAPDSRVFLACGFTPLHLQTFLAAQLRIQSPGHRVEVHTGLFGDLAGNLERLSLAGLDSEDRARTGQPTARLRSGNAGTPYAMTVPRRKVWHG